MRDAGMNIQTLLDEREIERNLSLFSRALDNKDFEAIESIFAADISFNYGIGGEQKGISAIRALFEHFLSSCGPTQHLLGSLIITIAEDGNHAVSRAYVQARHQKADDPMGPVLDTNGEYIDSWQRLAEGWRITRRQVQWQHFTGDADVLPSINKG